MNREEIYTTEYDKQLKQIQDIFWMPYVGKDYAQTDKKLLVVGLSYWPWGAYAPPYTMNADSEHFERKLTYDFLSEYECAEKHAEWKNFNLTVSSLMFARPQDAEIELAELKTAFYRIAKTNFIQNSAHTNATNNRIESNKSSRVLHNICTVLKPTHILVCGKSVYTNWEYIAKNKPNILKTYHPSAPWARKRYTAELPAYHATIKEWDLF